MPRRNKRHARRPPEEILPLHGKQFREYLENEKARFANVAGPHLITEEEHRERLYYHGKEITGSTPWTDHNANYFTP